MAAALISLIATHGLQANMRVFGGTVDQNDGQTDLLLLS